jgi:hypothetical protein
MSRTNNSILTFLLLIPITAFASGGDVIRTFIIDVIVVLALLIFIGFLNWKLSGKFLLFFILIISVFLTWIMLGSIPYQKNASMINFLSVLIPLFSVLSIFLLNRKKYIRKN